MIIKSIELENIRSYKNELIEFEEGINFLSGDIGSGKSSILHAIEFALFGFKRGDLEGFQLLRQGKLKASVKLKLFDPKNQKIIEIGRNLKKTKTTDTISQENGYIIENENLIELSPTELNYYVFNLLNFPQEFLSKDKNLIFRFTIYTPQDQLKEVLDSTPDKRLEIIRKIFQIDKYKQLRDAISIYSVKIREDKKVYTSKLENVQTTKDDIQNYKKDLDMLNKSLKIYTEKEIEFKDKLQKCKNAITIRDEKLNKFKSQILALEKEKTKLEEIEINTKKLEVEIDKKSVQLKLTKEKDFSKKIKDKTDGIRNVEKELEQIKLQKINQAKELEKYDSLMIEKENFIKTKTDYETKDKNAQELSKSFDYVLTKCKIKDLQNLISKDKNALKKVDKSQGELKELNVQIAKVESSIETLKNDIAKKEDSLKNTSKIDFCENCLQEVSHKHKQTIKERLEKEIGNINKTIDKENESLKRLKTEILKKEKEVELFNKLKEGIITNEEKLKAFLKQEENEKELNSKLKKLKEELSKTDFQKLENKINKIDLEIQKLKKIREDLDKLNEKETKIINKNSDLKLELTKLQNLLLESKKIEEEVENLKKDLTEKNTQLKEKKKLYEKINTTKLEEKKILEEKEKLNLNVEKLYENLRLLSNKSTSFKTQIEEKQKVIELKIKELEKLKDIQEKYEKLLKVEELLTKKVIEISSTIEKTLFTKYFVEFNEEFEKLFRELIEDNNIDVRLDDEFSPIIEQNGYEISIKNLSGGEKSSVAISYRLGLKRIIENSLNQEQNLSLLILDEPTDGFSNEQVSRLGNILREINTKQIILVSHDSTIESISENIIKIEKVNHISKKV